MNLYNVLIIENVKEICDGIEIYLKNQRYNVFKASNGVNNNNILLGRMLFNIFVRK